MPGTDKHNLRIPTATHWEPVVKKCARLTDQGYLGRARMAGSIRARRAVSLTDVLLWALEDILAETDEQTIARLGLVRDQH